MSSNPKNNQVHYYASYNDFGTRAHLIIIHGGGKTLCGLTRTPAGRPVDQDPQPICLRCEAIARRIHEAHPRDR